MTTLIIVGIIILVSLYYITQIVKANATERWLAKPYLENKQEEADWILFEKQLPPHKEMILAYSPHWIAENNPYGYRIGFRDGETFTSPAFGSNNTYSTTHVELKLPTAWQELKQIELSNLEDNGSDK